ncbi:MAG: AbrB/MazE/SpoVT family DNA-binding domain-containing protein [Halobacteriales archaeon]
MVTRKVQEVGGSTYTVSLPKEWAESAGITEGDEVHLQQLLDDILLVQPPGRTWDSDGQQVIDVDGAGLRYLDRIVREAYIAGLESVTVQVDDRFTDGERSDLLEAARILPGMTVTEQDEMANTLQSMIDASDFSPWQSVRQLSFLALTMHREAEAQFFDAESAYDMRDRVEEIQRLHALIGRLVRRGLSRIQDADELGLTFEELLDVWVTATQLRRVAREAKRIPTGSSIEDIGADAVAGDIRSVCQSVRGALSAAVSVVVGDADPVIALRALDSHRALQESVSELRRDQVQYPESQFEVQCLLASIVRTAECAATIANLGIQAGIREGELTGFDSDGFDDSEIEPTIGDLWNRGLND